MSKLKAILFDMDGVIVDTEPLHQKAYHRMFGEVGIQVSNELYRSFTGQSTLNICKQLCDRYELAQAPEELVDIKRKYFKLIFTKDDDLQLLDGVLSLIQDYKANGLTLIVASSASMPNINRVFDRFDLNRYFSGKLSGADLKESKPHPEIFIKAAQAANANKNECVVIEDSTNGIKAAHAAGIFCVGYDSKHSTGQDYSLANIVANDYEQIRYNQLMRHFI
ncbi:HAD family hydrolase [Gangjinia marincola]|uniref:HAD family hydrolase n=1 Tax=Gangjinia marincola TaxID=578463 RepID=A0ABN1MFK5_9FLAO